MSVIKHLSAEQLDLIPEYQHKWGAIAATLTPINRDHIRTAIRTLYGQLELPAPRICFFQGPETFYREFPGLKLLPTEALRQLINLGAGWGFLVILSGSFWCFAMTWMQPKTSLIQLFSIACIGLLYLLGWASQRYPQQNRWFKSTASYFFVGQIFVVSPVLYAWILRSHLPLAMTVGSLPLLFFVCLEVMVLVSKRRLENRWSQAIEAQINAQLSQQIQNQLLATWGVISLRSVPPPKEPLGSLLTLRWSYEQFSRHWLGLAPKLPSSFVTLDWMDWCSRIDFCVSVLGCTCNPYLWQAFQTLISEPGVVLPLQKICWVCDRPDQILLDLQQRPHAEAKAAIVFRDGSCIYAWHGVKLPPEYGRLHPHQWQANWVLSEQNAEVRRVLIEGIGYGRLCQELQAHTLDTWREYTLLTVKIPTKGYVGGQEVEEEPIHLLKMTCPSTNHIHVLRVPPKLRSARAAARWVNWDIDPAGFEAES
ncbi:MAG: hypothetical protein KME35_24500 [Aphanocapsa sp. GSE-SYN-MK-11-07L]|jgi:hypothetical protein|nr:hypothetical protein [Aphanocapsa sp. GSE-SYN-MK-11-07L]